MKLTIEYKITIAIPKNWPKTNPLARSSAQTIPTMAAEIVKASLLTTKRLLKCNPLFKPGYDPVPLTKEEKKQYETHIVNY